MRPLAQVELGGTAYRDCEPFAEQFEIPAEPNRGFSSGEPGRTS